jgi:hypothetical protein
MSRRSFAIFLLTAAFLLSAWSNVIAASFCPRYSAGHFSVTQTAKKSPVKPEPCHHELTQIDMDMDGGAMGMDSGSLSDSEISTNAPTADTPIRSSSVLELPGEPCGHCWMHSQPATANGTVVAQNPTSQSVQTDAPAADAAIAAGSTFIIPITPVEHGPPGDALPRHVLINVFRI